jgi:hypothetical protein
MQTFLKWLSLFAKILGAISAMDAIPIVSPKAGVIIIVAASILKDTVNRVGDWCDDRNFNASFGKVSSLLMLGTLSFGFGLMSGCSQPQIDQYKAISGAIPITVGGSYDGLTASFNSKTGITLWYDVTGKPVKATVGKPVLATK